MPDSPSTPQLLKRPLAIACRGCGHTPLESMFQLGNVPSVNSFPRADEIAREQPALLEVCVCPQCFLVQLSTLIPPAELFTEYRYLSAASQTQVRYLEELAQQLARRFGITTRSQILELGSNDGTLLAAFNPWTRQVLGVDPAKNLAPDAAARGVPTVADFLTETSADQILREHGPFDLVLGLNVIAHTPDLFGVLRAVRRVLKPGGTFMMEAVHVLQTILRGSYDTVYHEHVYCFSLTALREQFARAGLTVADVEETWAQGGSLRVFGQRTDGRPAVVPSVARMLETEAAAGITDLATYQRVGDRVRQHIAELRQRLKDLKRRQGRVWALGASARGVVIMNAGKIGTELLDAIVDDTPLKQGRVVPGVHVPVVGWEALRDEPSKPTAYLLTAWNYEREVLGKLRRFVADAEVLIPFPEIRTVVVEPEAAGIQQAARGQRKL